MKILFVVSRPLEINSSSSIRNIATIKGLVGNGHSVKILTSMVDLNHDSYEKLPQINNTVTQYLELANKNKLKKFVKKNKWLLKVSKGIYEKKSKMNLYDNYKSIIKHIDSFEIKDEEFDLIISSSDPKSSHLFVHLLFETGKLIHTPWIQIWGDPFFADITLSNKLDKDKIISEEKKLLKFPKKIVYVSEMTTKKQKELYPQYYSKMFTIPIPYNTEEIYEPRKLMDGKLQFLYSGDYTSDIRDIQPLYNFIKESNHNLIICGRSDLELEETENIKVLPRIPLKKVKELERNVDVLVHLSNKSGTQIPGKIYQYSGTNKAVLFIVDGEISIEKNAFIKYDRFIFSKNNISSLSEVIEGITEEKLNSFSPVPEFSPNLIAKNILLNFD